MITDEMLIQATKELAVAINSSLPEPRECSHQYSAKFERRIKRLILKENHPIIHHTLSTAASILIIITVVSALLLSVSVEAREYVNRWIRQKYEYFYEYFYDGVSEKSNFLEYKLDLIPEGYDLMTVLEISGGKVYIYSNESGNLLQFGYSADTNMTLYVEGAEYTQFDVFVNGMSGIVYIKENLSEANGIVWTDERQNVIFSISAFLDKDELILMAENVVVIKE